MLRISEIDNCFVKLSKEESLECVDCIPSIPNNYIRCWKLTTEILINNHVTEIELLIGFHESFPYTLPDIYLFDNRYDYIPHIDHETRKLCYIEDGVTYDVDHYTDVLRICIKKAKRLIEDGANNKNHIDFISEINSYWFARYNNEPMPLFNLAMYGGFPTESCLLDLFSYKEEMTLAKTKVRHVLIQQ